jgi:lipopolysaccharide export system permease protein
MEKADDRSMGPKMKNNSMKSPIKRLVRKLGINKSGRPLLTRIDTYIIGKFLGTFFFSIVMILAIVVVFDYNEKFDKFILHEAPARAIAFDYFLNFIPYFGVKFSPLFIFISVIYFTSKMAGNSEIIAMLSSGLSFNRLLRPYFISATLLAIMTFLLSSYVIPPANKIRLQFEDQYVRKVSSDYVRNVQMEIEPGVIIYMERYDDKRKIGYNFFMERYEGQQLVSRMTAKRIALDSLNRWRVMEYLIRDFEGLHENISMGASLDTTIMMNPGEFFITKGYSEQLTTTELRQYLDRQKRRGVANIKEYEVEYQRRFSFPFSVFILTLIGVSLASRTVRGGTGLHLGLGLLISFSYIFFDTLSGTFALSGSATPFVAVWIPNAVYALIAFGLYLQAPK